MADSRPYPKGNTRQIMDYNRFLSLTGTKTILCLDAGILEVCKYLLNTRGGWRTSYAIAWEDHSYVMPTEQEFEVFINAAAEANIDMASCNDIVTVLQELVDKPCCPQGTTTGSRGSGSTEQPPNPYNQSETPTEPPPGFSDLETFETHKCDAAQDLLSNLASDLIGLSGLTYAGSTPTGLVGALILFFLTPIPFDDLIGLAAYLIYSAFSYSFLAEMSAVIGDNQDDLRCILYNSDSAQDAQTNLLAELEELALAHFTTSDDANWVMGAVEYMLQYDAFNVLFQNLPTVSQGADCSACAECAPAFFETTGPWGTGSLAGTTWVLTGALIEGVYRIAVCACGAPATFVSITNYNPEPSAPGANDAIGIGTLLCGDPEATYDLWLDDDFPTGTPFTDVGQFTINSSTQHTVTITLP